MRLHHFATILLLGAAAAYGAGGCADQPSVKCQSAAGDFAVLYTLKSKGLSPACSALVVGGDYVGLQSFNKAGPPDELPDYKAPASLAMQDNVIGTAFQTHDDYGAPDPDASHKPYVLGEFAAAEPDGDQICKVPSFAAARQVLPEVAPTDDDPSTPDVDESDPGLPAFEGGAAWRDVTLYVSAAAPGTMFSGEVTYTLATTDDAGKPVTCTIDYHAVGLYPAVDCSSPVLQLDAKGNPVLDENGDPVVDHYVADPTLCSPDADPEAGRAYGSGINPDVKTKCAEIVPGSSFLCVLDGEPPAFK